MSDQAEDMKKAYTDEASAELARRREAMTEQQRDIAMEGTRQWQALYRDIVAALDSDPAGPVAQALVDRWRGLIEDFTRGDKGIEQGLGRAWQDRGNWSGAMKKNSEPFGDPRVWTSSPRPAPRARSSRPVVLRCQARSA